MAATRKFEDKKSIYGKKKKDFSHSECICHMDQLISFSEYSVGIFYTHFIKEKTKNSESEICPIVMHGEPKLDFSDPTKSCFVVT